ncbi:unnamed protein product [Haemonchus placei]|uniref:Uncharacterized protein n=1 Tax=Haemonchus placei TaxID=6290 RepID=A0A3P7TAL2_HAEPC|nr:unnamed protein product [Haemonchus placei]
MSFDAKNCQAVAVDQFRMNQPQSDDSPKVFLLKCSTNTASLTDDLTTFS